MYIFSGMKNRISFLRYGIDTPKEFILSYIDRLIEKLTGKRPGLFMRERRRRFQEGNTYRFKEIKFPLLDRKDEEGFFRFTYLDTFCSYMYMNDNYDEKTFDTCDKFLPEGLYGLVNDKVNVTVKPGDVVIDAGSWIGDFASYASVKGATVYAFEPAEENFAVLEHETARLNKNIIPVKMGLSDTSTTATMFINENSTSNSFMESNASSGECVTVETIRLDDFLLEKNLPRVDFIKCDIEGFERHMLAGAQETLARFAPKLALCTYHLPDDPEVMSALIKKANPRYNIVQKRMKLFASVPE